jgi:hypothetical protein
MAEEHSQQEPMSTQLTQPEGIDPKTGKPYEPVEIPVPKRDEVEDLLSRSAKPVPQDAPLKDQGDPLP